MTSRAQEWLITEDVLAEKEENFSTDEIWVVTTTFFKDLQSSPMHKVVKSRLANRTKYVYFAPDNNHTQGKKRDLLALLGPAGGKEGVNLCFCWIKDEEFKKLAAEEIVLYTPNNPTKKNAYLNLPVSQTIFWAEMHDSAAFNVFSNLHMHLNAQTGTSGSGRQRSRK